MSRPNLYRVECDAVVVLYVVAPSPAEAKEVARNHVRDEVENQSPDWYPEPPLPVIDDLRPTIEHDGWDGCNPYLHRDTEPPDGVETIEQWLTYLATLPPTDTELEDAGQLNWLEEG